MLCEVDCFGVMFSRMHGFMKKGAFTDVTFVVQGGSKIRAHKSVLAACSTVFEVMFQSSLIEGRRNEIEINDVNQEVLSAFLDYVYLRDAKIVKKHVNQLLMMADKYNVESLALLCDGFIEASLTSENAVDSLLLADLYRRDDLKTKIGRFIKKNLETISTHPGWAKLGDNFEVINGLIHSFIQTEDLKVCSKLSNSVTWTLRNVNDWYKKSEIMPWEALTFVDVDPKIVFNVTLTCFDYQIAVHIKVENKLSEEFSSVFVIRRRSITGVDAQTNIRLSWAPKTSEAQIYVPWDYKKEQRYCLEYPLFITVVVQKSDLSDRYQLVEHFSERNSRFADAEILTGNGPKFQVHKLVLSNNSEFFSERLKEDQKQYTILGMDGKTINRLLDYMYSLTNPSPGIVDLSLLKGAKQFQLDHLVEYCVSVLQNNIRHDNVVEICTTGEELGLEGLVSKAMDFMGKNPYRTMISVKWSTLKHHPRLTKDLLFKLKNSSQS